MSDTPLSAGRELDALVHQRVFNQENADPPYYSTDLLASFEVARFLRGEGYTVDVDNWANGMTVVRLKSPVEEEQGFVGDTPAEAICFAALEVVAQR